MLESAEPVKSAESAESAAGAGDESGRFIVQGLMKKTVGPDNGAVAAQISAAASSSGKIGSVDFSTNMGWKLDWPARQENSSRGTLTKAGSSGKIDSADFLMNMGWTLDWLRQAGKFIKGTR